MRIRFQTASVLLGLLLAAEASATLTLSPSTVSIRAGETSAPVTVTLTLPHQSASGTGRLLFRTFPAGVGTSPDPATYAYQGSAAAAGMMAPQTAGTGTFRLHAGTAVPPGTYRVTVADGTFASGTSSLTIVVSAAAGGGTATAAFKPSSMRVCESGAPQQGAVTITPDASFRGAVSATWINVPPGLTVTPGRFADAALPPSRTLAFTVRATGAPPGRATLTLRLVTATAVGSEMPGVVLGTFTLPVTVEAAEFTPQLSPAAVTVQAGGPAAAFAASISPSSCFAARTVKIGPAAVPAGLTVTPASDATNPPAWAGVRFSVTASAATPPGTYPVSVAFSPVPGAAATVRIPVTVTAGSLDVTAAFKPPALHVCDGGPPVQGAVTVAPESAFRGSLAAAWTSVPSGLTVTPDRFPEMSLPPSHTLSFSVRAQGASPGPGVLRLALTRAGGAARAFELPVTVEAADFNPAASPAVLALQAGGAAQTLAASLTAGACFSPRTVNVRVTGVPAGVTVTPQSGATAPPAWAPVQLSFAAGTAAEPGTYALDVVFEPVPGTAKSVRVALTVSRATGSVAAAVAPSPLRVCNGGPPVQGTLTLAPSGGYAGSPDVSWTAAPPGLTVSPPRAPRTALPPPRTSTFSLKAAGAAPGPTALSLSIADTAAGLRRTESIPVTVVDPEWTPSVSPSAVVVQASGAQRTVQASVRANDCFGSIPVEVTVAGVPAHVSVSPLPALVQPPGFEPAQLVIAVGPEAKAGTYQLTATFKPSVGAAKSLPVTLTITAGPDFQLEVVPPRAEVHAGDAVDVGVRASGLNGFAGTVQVVASAPAGVAVEPAAFALAPGSVQAVRVVTTRRRPPGAVAVTFTGTARGVPAPRAAELSLQVLPPRPTEEVVGPRVDVVTPGNLIPGAHGELVLEGKNFTPDTRVTFGRGITILGPLYAVSPTSARLRVEVDPTAAPGTHIAEASNSTGRNRGPGGLLIRANLPLPEKPRPKLQCTETVTLSEEKGKVTLEDPRWGEVKTGDVSADYPIPVLDDDTVFEWREDNPGTADGYEIRFFKRGRKEPVIVKRIGFFPSSGPLLAALGIPTYFRPDPAFLAELHQASRTQIPITGPGSTATIQQPSASANRPHTSAGGSAASAAHAGAFSTTSSTLPTGLFTGGGGDMQLPHGVYEVSTGSSQGGASGIAQVAGGQTAGGGYSAITEDQMLAALGMGDADMFWMVVGFKTCTAACTEPAPGQTLPPPGPDGRIEVEVERSGKWPLRLPLHPVGAYCTSQAKSAPFLVETSAHHKVLLPDGTEGPNDDPNHYPGDPFEMVGNGAFSLEDSPYASHPQVTMKTNLPPGVFAIVESFTFDNLFVDWGDGTVEPVTTALPAEGAVEWNRSVKLRLPDRNDCISGEMLEELVGGYVHFDDLCPAMPRHVYTHPGVFTVRLFVMAGDDVQNVNLAALGVALDGQDASPYLAVATSLAASGSVPLAGGGSLGAGVTATQGGAAAGTGPGGGGAKPGTGAGAPASQPGTAAATAAASAQAAATVPATAAAGGGSAKKSGSTVTSQSAGGVQAQVHATAQGTQFPQTLAAAKDVADRIHPIYCTTVTIVKRVDPAANGPLKLQSIVVTGYPPYTRVTPTRPAGPGIAAMPSYVRVSSCDEAVVATAELTFLGSGDVRLTWVVDGERFPMPSNAVASEPRTQAELMGDPSTWPPPRWKKQQFPSPILPVNPLGMHTVTVEAVVVPGTTQHDIDRAAAIKARHAGRGSEDPDDVTWADAVLASSRQQYGFLGPNTQAPEGLSQTAYVQGGEGVSAGLMATGTSSLATAGISLAVPFFVSSPQSHYSVAAADPTQPCTFDFPTAEGSFRVTGLQDNVELDPDTGRFSGTGKLALRTWRDDHLQDVLALLVIPIENWSVSELVTVEQGEIAVTAGPAEFPIAAHGLEGRIEAVEGRAGPAEHLEMTATLEPARNTVQRVNGSGKPSWKVRAPLHPDGSWYVEKDAGGQPLTLPESSLGMVPFVISSPAIVIDWSPTEGQGASSRCEGGTGEAWMGVRLGSLKVLPYTFDLVDATALQTTFTDWGIDLHGEVCGAIDIPKSLDTPYKEGRIRWDSITGSAANGVFHVYYNGFTVHDPWLDADLVPPGNRVELSENGLAITFGATTVTRTFGEDPDRITMTARDIRFTGVDGIPGWSLKSTADFELKADDRVLATFSVNDLVFDFYGRTAFPEGESTRTVALSGQSSHLGDTPVDLDSVKVKAAEQRRLDLSVFGTARLSDKLPSSPVQINYDVAWSGNAYLGSGPHTSPFTLDIEFPEGNPSAALKLKPAFFRSHSTHYSGQVDMSMYGGPPVTAQFLLGYDDSGRDYWLTRAVYDFGATGPVLVPGILQLMSIGGGLGYNFSADALKDPGPLEDVQPDMQGGHLFSAEMMVGSCLPPPAGFTYTFRGVLSVTTAPFESRLDFSAWFLTNDHSGQAPLGGYFRYASGSFDGAVYGGFDVMNGSIGFALGTKAEPAVRLHFGSDDWYIKAGDRNGQRITCHFLIVDADGYLEIGSQGLYVGAGLGIYMGASVGPLSAHVSGRVEGGASLTAGPQLAGYAEGSVSAEACCCGLCIGPTISVGVNMGAWNPVTFGCHACFEFDLLLATVKKCANFSI